MQRIQDTQQKLNTKSSREVELASTKNLIAQVKLWNKESKFSKINCDPNSWVAHQSVSALMMV